MKKSAALTALADNHVTTRGLRAEHGLSLLVETPGANILFDTGASSVFSDNARALKIELFGVDSIVLSHGHCDHADGLAKALFESPNAHLVLHRGALLPKIRRSFDAQMIGTGISPESLKAIRAAEEANRATFIEGPVKLGPNIIVFPAGPRNAASPEWPYFIQKPDGNFAPDFFNDELAMVVIGDEAAALVLGDAHCGIVRSFKRATELAGGKPVKYILGGSSIDESNMPELQAISNFLLKTEAQICLGHATGLEGYSVIRRVIGGKVHPMRAGLRLELDL